MGTRSIFQRDKEKEGAKDEIRRSVKEFEI
jgi:hypothetical protein